MNGNLDGTQKDSPRRSHRELRNIKRISFDKVPPFRHSAHTCDSESYYQYLPLPSTDAIRLLYLQPGTFPAPIQCHLVPYIIDDAPQFEALSYTWGRDVRHTIGCDDGELSIQESLWLALQRLRDSDAVRVIWIDAICISQTDLNERNDQVLLMRRLFHKAVRVVVWLGEESDDSVLAFELIQHLVTSLATPGHSANPLDTTKVFEAKDLISAGLPDHASSAWKALDSLFWRPWFTRVWVIQEITVARDAMVLCGSLRCQWSEVQTTAKLVADHSLTAVTGVDPARAIKLMILANQFRQGLPHLLLKLLSQAQDAYSTDGRDKIFALLGIAADAEYSLLKPDYKLPLVEVFTKLTRRLIERDRTLDILSAVEDHGFRSKRNRKEDQKLGEESWWLPKDAQLPHWVPDWEVHRPSSSFLMHPAFGSMRASGTTEANCDFSNDSCALCIRGLLFDRVTHVGDSFLDSVAASGSISPTLGNKPFQIFVHTEFINFHGEQRWRQWERIALNLGTYPTGEEVLDAYIRTLVGNASFAPGLTNEALRAYYAAWRKYWKIASTTDKKYIHSAHERSTAEEIILATRYMEAQLSSAYGRRFFTTAKGYMGLCNLDTRVGHLVVILHGGRTPYLIRKNGSKGYQFVGECYVHGLMSSEAMDQSIPEQDFVLH